VKGGSSPQNKIILRKRRSQVPKAKSNFQNRFEVLILATRSRLFEIALARALFFSPGRKTTAFRQFFCNAKDKECGAGNVRHVIKASKGDKYATPDSTRGRIDASPLRADNRRRFMLRWAAATSDVDFVTKKQS
jgi:hypothetical protein